MDVPDTRSVGPVSSFGQRQTARLRETQQAKGLLATPGMVFILATGFSCSSLWARHLDGLLLAQPLQDADTGP
ncbi:hypothetical protein ACFONI_14550 [Aeromonas media]|uniref:hypothetical protein n=1 Tax=Aeromonas media TaxID=651 RepID=UPI003614EDD8